MAQWGEVCTWHLELWKRHPWLIRDLWIWGPRGLGQNPGIPQENFPSKLYASFFLSLPHHRVSLQIAGLSSCRTCGRTHPTHHLHHHLLCQESSVVSHGVWHGTTSALTPLLCSLQGPIYPLLWVLMDVSLGWSGRLYWDAFFFFSVINVQLVVSWRKERKKNDYIIIMLI